jgi:hypothetical protein
MELNESLVKVDMSLDSNVKKVEKQAKELQAPDLMIELTSSKCILTWIYDWICVIVTAFDYIRSFKWDDGKYPRNKSLVEITGLIAEVNYI